MQNYVEIIDNLYLSNLSCTQDSEFMNSMKLIINLSMYPYNITNNLNECEIMNIDIYDEPTEKLSSYFDLTFNKIDDILTNNKGNVLIYCKIGKSRSVSIIINYLMTKFNICYDLAFIEIIKKKSEVGPNYGFIKQLKSHYENRLKKQNMYHEINKKNTEQIQQLKTTLEQKMNGKKTQNEWELLKKDREILRYIENIN